MDEIFHIPQAEAYCKGNFMEWNDKITTLPGLYFITVGILNPLAQWQNRWLCTTSTLRAINVGFAALTTLVLHKIMLQLHGDKHVRHLHNLQDLCQNISILFFSILIRRRCCSLPLTWLSSLSSISSPFSITRTSAQRSW